MADESSRDNAKTHKDYWAHPMAWPTKDYNLPSGTFRIAVAGVTIVDRIDGGIRAEEGATAINQMIRNRFTALFKVMGTESSPCKLCKATMFWVPTKAGKTVPYSLAGVAHMADCPKYEKKA